MSLIYQIYSNAGRGGPVDYSTPIAETTSLSYVSAPLAPSGDYTFAVRVLDAATNLSEANTDVSVRIVIDAQGNDISGLPGAPHSLSALATAAGGCHVTWAYTSSALAGTPTGFFVYLTPGTSPSYLNPAADVPYIPGQYAYSCDLTGLADQTTYCLAVRAYNVVATETNTTVTTTVLADASAPDDVDSLTVAVI